MKKIFFKFIGIVISILFIFLVLEIFLRINPKFGYIYDSFKKTEVTFTDINFKNFNSIRPSALLGYELIPGVNEANAYGLVGKEYNLRKAKNTFRILLLGDSIAWQDITRQFLEKQLNTNVLLNQKRKFEIWNYSCPSYDVRRYALCLQHKGLAYKPDMVIIFLCMNDFDLNSNFYYKNNKGAVSYWMPLVGISRKYVINPFLIRHSYLYRFLVLKIDNYLVEKKDSAGLYSSEKNGEYYMKIIKDMCADNNIQLFAVIYPYFQPLSEYKDYQARQSQEIHKVIENLGVNYIDLYKYLPEQDLHSLRYDKEDEMHPGEKGCILIGKIIYDYLLEKCFDSN